MEKAVNLFLNLSNKANLVQLVEAKHIEINGFRNYNKVPLPLLKQQIKKWFEKNEYQYFIHFIHGECKSAAQSYLGYSLESYIHSMSREEAFYPENLAFGVFLYLFPDEVDNYLPLFKKNYQQGKNIFDIELDIEINKENVNQVFSELCELNIFAEKFYRLFVKVSDKLEILGYEDVEGCFEKVKGLSWIDFVRNYVDLLKEYEESVLLFAYLVSNEKQIKDIKDSETKKMHLFLMFQVLIHIDKEYLEATEEQLFDVDLEMEEQREKIKGLENENLDLKRKIRKTDKKLNENQKKYQEEKEKNEKLNQKVAQVTDNMKEKQEVIQEKEQEIINLREKVSNSLNPEDFLVEEIENKNKIILVGKDSVLYKMFIGDYLNYNCDDYLKFSKNDLKNQEAIVIIDRNSLNTQQLLEWEEVISKYKLDKHIISAYSEVQFIKTLLRNNLI